METKLSLHRDTLLAYFCKGFSPATGLQWKRVFSEFTHQGLCFIVHVQHSCGFPDRSTVPNLNHNNHTSIRFTLSVQSVFIHHSCFRSNRRWPTMQIMQQDVLTNFVSCSLLHSWLSCEHTWGAVPGILSPSSSQISLSLYTNTETNSDTNEDIDKDTNTNGYLCKR